MDHIMGAVVEVLQPWLEVMPPILLLGLALLIGAVMGEGAARLKLPRLLGYWVTGIACYAVLVQILSDAPGNLSIKPHDLVRENRQLFELALGFVLVELGRRLQLQWLLKNRALFATTLLESLATFAAVAGILYWWGYDGWTCLLIAAVFISTSPVVIAAVVAQSRAEGQISERAMHLAAVNTIVASVLASGLLTAANSAHNQGDWARWLLPVWGLVTAAAIGTAGGQVLRMLLRKGGRWAAADGAPLGLGSGGASSVAHAWGYGWQVFIGVVLAALGIAQWLHAPILVAALVLGITATHGSRLFTLERQQKRTPAPPVAHRGVPWPDTAPLVPLLSAGLMMFAAAALPWSQWWQLAYAHEGTHLGMLAAIVSLALALVLTRAVAKLASVSVAAPWANARRSQNIGLALALQPTAVTGLALLMQVQQGYAPLQAQATQAAWLALALLDCLAPIILLLVLRYSDEATSAIKLNPVTVSPKSPMNRMAEMSP
jgi:Kef-type K+ transport system membrane component KefB